MTDKIEIKGKTVNDAVSEALLRMGARRDEVRIKVLEEPKGGFLGFIGGRQAHVLVERKQRGSTGSGRRNDMGGDGQSAHELGRGRGRSRRGSRGGSGRSGRPSGSGDTRSDRNAGGGANERDGRGNRSTRDDRNDRQSARGRGGQNDRDRDQNSSAAEVDKSAADASRQDRP